MKQIDFIVYGNQEDSTGNPLPYFRTTQGSRWSPGARRYSAWKTYVRAAYFETLTLEQKRSILPRYQQDLPPIVLGKKEYASVEISAFWHDGAHGDLDNILKGVLDALFENDKGVTRFRASSQMATDARGTLFIKITIK